MSDKEISEKDFYKWLGKRLRKLREKAGMKQKELAAETGIDAPFISKVENTGKKISVYQLNRLLTAMGYTQADLTADEDIKKKLTITLNGDSIGKMENGEKRKFMEQVKLFIKLLFSAEIYDELAQEFQQQADAKRELKRIAADNQKANHQDAGDCPQES